MNMNTPSANTSLPATDLTFAGRTSTATTSQSDNQLNTSAEQMHVASLRRRPRTGLRRTGRSLGGPRRTCSTEGNDGVMSATRGRRRAPPRRVVSMCVKLSEPSHHTLSPRRSSMSRNKLTTTNTQLPEEKSRQRVSFEKAAFNQVPLLSLTDEEKKQIWYNDEELSKQRKKVKKLIRKGEGKLDESEDCWRGLESYVKKFAALDSSEDETEECNKIILQLTKELSLESNAEDKSTNSKADLQCKAQNMLLKAMKEGTQQAAKDAKEAHDIYMETMDSEQVQACFQSARVA